MITRDFTGERSEVLRLGLTLGPAGNLGSCRIKVGVEPVPASLTQLPLAPRLRGAGPSCPSSEDGFMRWPCLHAKQKFYSAL